MSFNIRYGTAKDGENRWALRRDLVARLMREHRPDVAGLQEALRFQLDELRAALPHYGEMGAGRDDGVEAGEYAAILYDRRRFACDEGGTYWLSETPDVPGSRSWGAACTRICTWARLIERSSGRGLYVFNVHLDHVSEEARTRGIEVALRRMNTLARNEPVILLGDFNAPPESAAILSVLARSSAADDGTGEAARRFSFRDTFGELHRGATGTGTFNEFKGVTSGPRIDYIFATPDLVPRETCVLHDNDGGRYPSDHFPVLAILDRRLE
jgi:endonuclease/exonuclease/phosphatase family metal-dependent hydrolase